MLRVPYLLSIVLLLTMPVAADAALEPIPALDEPQAIEEEISEVRELTGIAKDLVGSGRRELVEWELVLIEEENSLFDNASQIASLREARSHLDGLQTRISTVTALRFRTARAAIYGEPLSVRDYKQSASDAWHRLAERRYNALCELLGEPRLVAVVDVVVRAFLWRFIRVGLLLLQASHTAVSVLPPG